MEGDGQRHTHQIGCLIKLSYPALVEKETATHSSILAWRISWTEGHGGQLSKGSQTVGQD